MTERFEFNSIGRVHSPYKEKFAIPRQPGLASAAKGYIELLGDCNREEILRGIEGFSHVWLNFVFHQAIKTDWKPMVRPPRLGGNKKVGVFASRSPFRPNPIGLSVVKLEGIEEYEQSGKPNQWRLNFSGGDLLDGTPILDIKPYIPYADALPEALGGFAEAAPDNRTEVSFSPELHTTLQEAEQQHENFATLVQQVLAQQPEPAYHKPSEREYGVQLYNYNVRWRREGGHLMVFDISQVETG
jgi:tRNA-Thr(GGU) m(6)t(6)A37 methyltransferase TsaA